MSLFLLPLSPVSCLLSPVSCLLSPVSCLLSLASCHLSPVLSTRYPLDRLRSAQLQSNSADVCLTLQHAQLSLVWKVVQQAVHALVRVADNHTAPRFVDLEVYR
jgi:hypothetical protein